MTQLKLTEKKAGSHGVKPNPYAFMALLLGAVGIAFAPIFVRLSELGPSATAFYRLGFAAPLLGLWLWTSLPTSPPLSPRQRVNLFPLMSAGCFFAADLAVWHWSIQFTSVANATLLANFAPIFVVLAGWLLFGQTVSRWFVAALALVLSGATLLVSASIDTQHLFGDALGLLTAIFYAGYILSVARLRLYFSTAIIAFASSTVGATILFFVAWLSGESFLPVTTIGWLSLVGLACISQVIGQSLIMFALAHLPSAFASVSLLLQPVTAAILAWRLFGEALTLQQGLGGVIVLAGIVLARWSDRKLVS
ncbi:DMT family transporter [Acaryochloris marina]|uniref:DMT family transporter n=1 Tax=Acaryochloris marina TaxID=155978 RepID=UPI001BB08453|nr:DMT family transporter [Acaryochloris marina]QUY40565.1 DMT family transporter [Acaryochloris marina S15]